ncbi:MAG: hypothetical protein R3B92_03505 [Patescibacteria group bacterium]|uniref:Uncharacterized protein n=1 Tax=candidate division WWE3 bacterium TaxID=2053526 RepID=A0A955J240_UNCKA|nr:hypothetical protein [candidate division WWE3 bacterium]MCB0367875.1 hypothetical protein [Bdellovibrionales bacterium]
MKLQSQNLENLKIAYTKFLAHVYTSDVVLCGGVVMRHYIENAGLEYPNESHHDIDILLSNPASLYPSVKEDFVIRHYHLNNEMHRDEFYFNLYCPETKIVLDIFDAKPFPPIIQETVMFDMPVKIRSIEDQFATRVIELARVLQDTKIRKSWYDVVLVFSQLIDFTQANFYYTDIINSSWFKKYAPELQEHPNIEKMWKSICKKIENMPELLQEDSGATKKEPKATYECKECVVHKEFPITAA